MLFTPAELRDIHAEFGDALDLIERRRALYGAVMELAGGREVTVDPDVLDSPVARAHMASVVVDPQQYRSAEMVSLSRVARGATRLSVAGAPSFVVGAADVRPLLDAAVRHISSELAAHGPGHVDGVELMLDDDPAFGAASDLVVAGVDTAWKVCPDLVEDLVPHVALFAVIGNRGTDQLGSASIRDFPGLIVVPEPGSAIEVAEAVVHEGAHQKFFDLGLTRSIFSGDFHGAPLYTASWSSSVAPGWPLEQCAAAFHAYTCLATFHACLEAAGSADVLHDFSLLPVAEARAAELADWVTSHERFFGPDGWHLMRLLTGDAGLGEQVAGGACVAVEEASDVRRQGGRTALRRCGEWTLVARLNDVIRLFWAPTADVARANGDRLEGHSVA